MHNIFLEDKDKNGCTIAENAGFFKPCLKKISQILVMNKFLCGKAEESFFIWNITISNKSNAGLC